MNLSQRDLSAFSALRIPPDLIEMAGIVRVTDREARENYGIRGSGDMAGGRTGRKILPLAMGGYWGWKGKIGIEETATGERSPKYGPIPDLNICRDGRKTYVLLDSNCRRRPDIQQGRAELVRQLRKQGADTLIIDLPAISDVNGPDDYVGLMGDEAFLKLLESACYRPAENGMRFFSEDELALAFTDAYPDFRYVSRWGKWMRLDAVWREDAQLKVFDRAREICRGAAEECGEKEGSTVKRLRASQTVAAVERLARCDPQHAAVIEQWDTNLLALGTPSGTCELDGEGMRENRAEDYITKSTAGAPKIADSPQWHSFLDRITAGDVELQRYLQRMAGYCLTGITTEHVLFFLYGTGANGKTTFTNTLLGIWGDYGQVASIETFTEQKNDRHPCDLAAMRGARLVVASETEAAHRWAESRIKALTGGEPVRARFMRCDEFEYIPQFKLMIQGNHKPALRSVDEAIRRRVHMVPFLVTIPREERDSKLAEKLRGEWPAILQWAINGCIAWQQAGLNPPQAVRDATAEYLANEDAIGRWLDERCIVSPQVAGAKSSILYADFKTWAEATGEYAGSQKRFSQDLKDRGFVVDHKRGGSFVERVVLREQNDE